MYKSLIFSTAFELRPRGGGCDRRQLLAFRNDHCNLRDRGTSLHLLMQMPSEVLRFAFRGKVVGVGVVCGLSSSGSGVCDLFTT